jgi:hypothetical protein
MGSTYTPNLGLKKPIYKDPDTFNAWDVVVNMNMNTIDATFGNRNYTEQNYITNTDDHTSSIDKLDMGLKDVADLAPTSDQKDALAGEGTPSGTNKYVTKDYVRLVRKEILFPEFQSSTFVPSPGGANIGILITEAETVGNYIYNYYKWVSSEGAFQNYDISIQWRVPETLESWHLTKALIIDICTQEDVVTNNFVTAILSKDGVAGTVTSPNSVSSSSGVWCAERTSGEIIVFSATDLGTTLALAPGDTLNITIRMNSQNSKYVKIGAITIQYVG